MNRSRVAAVDCGTNSIRLLIADVDDGGFLHDVRREMRIVRLGQGVDATGAFVPEAIERTRVALHEYVEMMLAEQVSTVRMVATSATRDAANREDFFAMTRAELEPVSAGAQAEVITGETEARLSFAGAVCELDVNTGPFLVADLGGGSTELVLGDENGVRSAFSADIGCVRVTERCLTGNPPSTEEIRAARNFITEKLSEAFAKVPVEDAHTWVGVAGTFTTLSAVAQNLPDYDPDRVHLSRLTSSELSGVSERLLRMPRADRAALGAMHPGRVDVIGGGSLIAAILADELRTRAGITELVVSEHDILDGIAQSLVPAL